MFKQLPWDQANVNALMIPTEILKQLAEDFKLQTELVNVWRFKVKPTTKAIVGHGYK